MEAKIKKIEYRRQKDKIICSFFVLASCRNDLNLQETALLSNTGFWFFDWDFRAINNNSCGGKFIHMNMVLKKA